MGEVVVFNEEVVARLRGINAVSRRLRALGFAVDAQELCPGDGGLPVIALRGVCADRQKVLRSLGAIVTVHVDKHLCTAALDGVRLAWQDAARADGSVNL